MDNLVCHKPVAVTQALEAVGGTVLYLPPYNPDLNPIELAFSTLKELLRSAGARPLDRLWGFLGRVLDAFAPDECRRYIQHCGYEIHAATMTPNRD
ncbi:Putative transposase of insertion sequence ISRm10-1, orfBC-terminus protein OS=Parvularcula bermudensis (strain ATCC BAA-594 / HTCC2503 / KCTC 12087) GN=PB2503_10919 PE=4 SV=1: DDE_3 [Gemmata massiliana]|uniref:Tc1-like transposase DDE domain-containing protein n=2 Tax=Gemmata massiliana TaxID=1210884 RepID=A0A6P2D280_9BACT|nr:Putative transposase of insertion sequence ISRm10-1, orfBC-terminus protein OS=Parvularcula bermudensis (strain ATCC BAA-594 / HTCC2503 / KCTC 12087) GN=PB2503_10919 PE=4 SV=1: DDE_3 [Gemmata massiliana]